jgi:cytochrome b5
MSADKEFTFSDVAEHASKKDLYLVIHDKVYNTSSFIDEHPYVLTCCPMLFARSSIFLSPDRCWKGDTMRCYRRPHAKDFLSSGGEEVLLDVGGQDATEAFEDVGHSDEAREILDGLLVGTLKRVVCLTLSLSLSS